MPRSIGRDGAGACTIVSQLAQASLGRTRRITLKRTGSSSSISEMSSPRCLSVPPQSGQLSSLRRNDLRFARQDGREHSRRVLGCSTVERAILPCSAKRLGTAALRAASSSSTHSSNCSIWLRALFAASPKLQAAQFENLQLERFDFSVSRKELRIFGDHLLILDDELRALLLNYRVLFVQ